MSKKERMLEYISNNLKWLLSTDSFEFIPYYSMSNTVFSRAKEYLVNGDVVLDDVVCLVSTSILELGKSGILFTTDAMYCKSWGIFTKKCRNHYFNYEFAEFNFYNEFYEERMKGLMKDLYGVSIDENKCEKSNQKINNLIDIGYKVGAALGGLLDIVSYIGDEVVSKNNGKIIHEISNLENSSDDETINVIKFYKEFILLINQFSNVLELALNEGDDICEETSYAVLLSLQGVFLVLYDQTTENIDISPEDYEEYILYSNWLIFWALMFYDGEQFREAYPIELLEEMPEWWSVMLGLMDEVLEDVWEGSFSGTIYEFAETVINNNNEALELMSCSDFDDEFINSMSNIVESNNKAVKFLEDVLNRATNYLNDQLPNIEEE